LEQTLLPDLLNRLTAADSGQFIEYFGAIQSATVRLESLIVVAGERFVAPQ